MREAHISNAVRKPIGLLDGASSSVGADDIAAVPLGALMERDLGLAPRIALELA